MLARKKSLNGGVGVGGRGSEGHNGNTPTTTPNKKALTPGTPTTSGGLASALTFKREEKESPLTAGAGKKRPLSIGQTVRTERTLELGEILDRMIPGMQEALFSSETSNLRKANEMKKILNCLNDWGAINDQVVLNLVGSMKQNVDSFDETFSSLVVKVLDGNWPSRSTKVIKAFEDFISELVITHNCYAGVVLHSLIKKFIPITPGDPQNPDIAQPEDEKVFEVAHRNLKRLLKAFPIPRMRDSCVKTMGGLYPPMMRGPYIHYCYVKNLIFSTSYIPQISTQILHLCIHMLCRFDVNVLRMDSEKFSEVIEDEMYSTEIKGENGKRLHVSLDFNEIVNSIILRTEAQLNPLVNVLDLCLVLMFQCFETMIESKEDNEDELDTFFDALINTFETEVLPSFGINHVQFLYFYLVSTNSTFTKRLLDFLWKKATNFNTPAVIRMQCMSYISGILSRSTLVSVKMLKRWLSKMAEWANVYIDQRAHGTHWSSVNVQMHGPFYAVCQTIFYVFAFRNKDLVGLKKCVSFTGTLNLGRLVTCDLNPLKAVIPPVAITFVKASHVHQISYCQTVLERNRKATIPTSVRDSLNISAMDSLGPDKNILETFFPFDPFLLPRSKKWIDPIYRKYEAYLPEVKNEKSEERPSRVRCSEENEDSIDMELSTSFQDRSGSQLMARLMDSSIRFDYGEDMDDA